MLETVGVGINGAIRIKHAGGDLDCAIHEVAEIQTSERPRTVRLNQGCILNGATSIRNDHCHGTALGDV